MVALRYFVVLLVLEDNSVSLFSRILIVSLTLIDFFEAFHTTQISAVYEGLYLHL